MMPFYGYPDSYPFDENQVPVMQYHRPNFGVIPPHTNVDSSKSTVIHEPWSYASNNGYSAPCHACCGHGYGNFPGHYSYRPPYPRISFPQFPWCAHHSTFPAHYFPPPYCSMDHPRCEYDKGVPRDYFYHCCGCPNHNHNQMNDEHVKVEEQELDGERKGVNYLAPSEVKSYPYPIVCVSPNLMTNRSHRKPLESKMASEKRGFTSYEPS